MGRGWKIVIGMLIVMAAFVLAGVPLYVFPASDEPRAVDAVYVLGPATPKRMEVAESMMEAGLAQALVISHSSDPGVQEWLKEATAVCEVERAYPVYCDQPEPFTTRGEARWISDLATQHGWESVAVITVAPHISRTRLIMERCWDGEFLYVDPEEYLPLRYWVHHFVYQSGAFVKAAFGRGC